MYLRNFSLAAAVSILASGLWYYQQERSLESKTPNNATASSTSVLVPGSGLSTSQISTLLASQASTTPALENKSPQPTIASPDFYISELEENPLLIKQGEDQGINMLGTLTPEQATQKLRRTEESYHVNRGRGVLRYDLVQIPSNNPIEDDHAEKIVSVPHSHPSSPSGSMPQNEGSDWMFWGVFDGHSGWTTSAKLRQVLISFVFRELTSTYAATPSPSPASIDQAIQRGFLLLDHSLVHTPIANLTAKTPQASTPELLSPALSGSCALLSFYDTSSKLFRVACTGDSRAVLGHRSPTGRWIATALSEDQTGGTPSEMARLRAEHPGEDYVTHNGRILGGLEPSRAFGDASYKWSRETQEKVKRFFFGRTPSKLLKTPPYVTAEPVVTTTHISPERGDFVVLATDGLWEMLTNEEVVGLVGKWMDKYGVEASGKKHTASWTTPFFGEKKGLPVEKSEDGSGGGGGQRAPIRQEQYHIEDGAERFVVEDPNAATHLVRNALGGRNRDLVCALLSLVSPRSRSYRFVSLTYFPGS